MFRQHLQRQNHRFKLSLLHITAFTIPGETADYSRRLSRITIEAVLNYPAAAKNKILRASNKMILHSACWLNVWRRQAASQAL